MTAIIACGAISALGEGERAYAVGAMGERARVAIARDAELDAAGLARPYAARASIDPSEMDRAAALVGRALEACARALDAERPGWRDLRVGLAVGTSSGGMRTAERFFRGARIDPRAASYGGPLDAALVRLGITASPATLVLGACASSAIAIGLGVRWIDQDMCDLVLAGGFDAVSVFVAAGFEALRATTAAPPPRPFRTGRDGMSLGEGAAIVALAPAAVRAQAYVAGFGASCDAVHVTAPDRTGAGLARAAARALEDAGVRASEVDLVSGHATATPYNDAAEARALATVLGARARDVVMHPMKAQIGHTLGAAGVLETLACVDAMARGILPAAAGAGALDPDAPARLLDANAEGAPRVALKLASAFGGANAALVLTRDPPRAPRVPRRGRPVYVTRAFVVKEPPPSLASRVPPQPLARTDTLVRLAIGAVAALDDEVGPLAGAGIIAGHSLGTLETNALFHAKLAAHGPRLVEPRRFPYTSPNAVCGECAVLFGLTGPGFAVGAGPHGSLEALAIARDLVAAGDADRLVVVAVDDVGPAAHALLGPDAGGLEPGAAAVLVTADPTSAAFRIETTRLVLGPEAPCATGPLGHSALARLAEPEDGLTICLSPGVAAWGVRPAVQGAFAKLELVRL